MKKVLLTLTACIAISATSMAQLTEDFESTTGTGLPVGWTQTVVPTSGPNDSVGFNSGTNSTLSSTSVAFPAHTRFVALNDDKYAGANNSGSMLISPTFSMASLTNPYLSFDCSYAWGSYGGFDEFAQVMISVSGGPWTLVDTIWSVGGFGWNTQHMDLAAWAGSSSVQLGFLYKDNTGWLFGLGLDNISVYQLSAISADATGIGYNSAIDGVATNSTPLSFRLMNTGVTITSFDAQYTVNGGAPVTQNFTGLSVAPYTNAVYTFGTAMTGATATGVNTVVVTITNVNGVANTSTNNTINSTFVLASTSVTRQGLIEEFSSSTCAPCKVFNQNWDPLMVTLNANTAGTNLNVLKYQMNWPSPGNDRSYNPDGDARKTYYAVNGIPDHFVNGQSSSVPYSNPFTATNTANFTAEADNSHANNAFFDMTATYSVDTGNKNMKVTVTVTPRFTKTGSYRLYVAVADKYYENTTNTTGQLKYYHVTRKMLPNGNGTALAALNDGTAQTFNLSHGYTATDWTAGSGGYPSQGSYTFWNNPLSGSELIAFVEDDTKKSVMQSLLAFPVASLSVSTMSKVNGINVYPNPVRGLATVRFNLEEAGNVQVKVVDFAGRTVSEVISKDMAAGTNSVAIPTGNIAAGNYVVVVSTATGNNVASITVE